jgi:hypothetical protein
MNSSQKNLSRKDFLKSLAIGSAAAVALPACNAVSSATGMSIGGPSTAAQVGMVTSLVSTSPKLFVNVQDHGAKGDGLTDDTAAIQSAIQSNAVIFFPAATYLISNVIQLNSLNNVHISAVGATFLSSNLTTFMIQPNLCQWVTITGGQFLRTAPITATSPSDQAAIRIISCTDVIVQNILIDGSPGMGIGMENCINVKILNNTIRNTTRDGVYSHYGVNLLYSGNYLENIKDDALSMHDYGYPADKANIIALGYPQAGNSVITNNKIRYAMRGIASIGLKGLTVSDNSIDHITGCGISIFNTGESYVNQDPVSGCGAQDVIITNNQISFTEQASTTILGGVFTDGNQNGDGKAAVSVGSYDAGFQYGLNLRRLTNVTVTGNQVVSGGVNGYFLNNIDGLVFSNNSARNCNLVPLAPYTGYIVEIWNSKNLSAFNNSVIDSNATPNTIGGCRTWNTTGITGGWLVSGFTGSDAYLGLPGTTAVNVVTGSPVTGATSVPAVKY